MGANPSSFYPMWKETPKLEEFDLSKSAINSLTKEDIEAIIKEALRIRSGDSKKIMVSNDADGILIKYVFAYFSKK